MQALLRAVLDEWDAAFRSRLPSVARSYVHELLDVRNRWAHEEPFTDAEAERALDTIRQLASLMGAPIAKPAPPDRAPRTHRQAVGTSSIGGPRPSQRDVMRAIYARCGGNIDDAVNEYAASERRGEVARRSNSAGVPPEAYARALLQDGERKGWLPRSGA